MKARDILKKHFPDLNGEALKVEMTFMSPALICEGSHLEMVVRRTRKKKTKS